MAALSGVRSAARVLSSTQTSIAKQVRGGGLNRVPSRGMSGVHGHVHEEPFYVHAKHMYNLDMMKYRKLKLGLFVFSIFTIGVGVPIVAVVFQQKKTSSV